MLANQGQAAEVVELISPAAAADTAAATSSWIDVRKHEGDLVFIVQIGTITAGGIVPTIEDATDGSGTGAATITPNEGALAGDADTIQKVTINAKAVRGWIRFLGTITTGPVEVSAALLSHPKYTS